MICLLEEISSLMAASSPHSKCYHSYYLMIISHGIVSYMQDGGTEPTRF